MVESPKKIRNDVITTKIVSFKILYPLQSIRKCIIANNAIFTYTLIET